MMYFENARLEFFGVPLAYIPYFSAPDPTVKRKTGVLVPSFSSSTIFGVGVAVPYYWALAPNYDFTFTPMITTRQGPLLQGEWRQRLVNGSYFVRASGMSPARQGCLPPTTASRRRVIATGAAAWRPRANSISRTSGCGAGTGRCSRTRPISRTTACSKNIQSASALRLTPDYALSQLYLAGRGDRSYFDMRDALLLRLLPVGRPEADSDRASGHGSPIRLQASGHGGAKPASTPT